MKKDAPVVLPVTVDSPLGKAYGHTTVKLTKPEAMEMLLEMMSNCVNDERCGTAPCPCGFWQPVGNFRSL